MSTQSTSIVKLPVDLSPSQRAGLKLLSHFAIIALFNGCMAGLAVATNGKAVTWQMVGMAVLGQAVLALLDAMKKYYTASNQLPLSTLFDLARSEAAAKIPAVQYTPTQQAISNQVNALLQQTDASPNAATNAAKPATLAASPSDLKPEQSPAPASTTVEQNYPPVPTENLQNSLPNLAAIKVDQQAQ